MSAEEHNQLVWVAMQFHLLICPKLVNNCPRCRAALLAKEQLRAIEDMRANRKCVVAHG